MYEKKILVTYATMSGSTQEIAEFVANELIRQGKKVEVYPCRTVSDVNGYAAVVVGMPIYMFRIHKDAARFFQRQQKHLTDLPIAVFAGGPYGPNYAQGALTVQKNLDAEMAKYPWLHPVSVLLVGGRFDPDRLRFPYNLIPALKQAAASDARNWDEIRDWASSLCGRLAVQNDGSLVS